MNYPLVGLHQVNIDDADEHALERSQNTKRLLVKKNKNKTCAALDMKTLTTHLLDTTWLALTTS